MNRRKAQRKNLKAPVDFTVPGWPYRRTIDNISEDGMLVCTRDTLPPGTELDFLFDLKGKFMKVKGRIIWTRLDRLGVRFLPGVGRDRVQRLVKKIPQTNP